MYCYVFIATDKVLIDNQEEIRRLQVEIKSLREDNGLICLIEKKKSKKHMAVFYIFVTATQNLLYIIMHLSSRLVDTNMKKQCH